MDLHKAFNTLSRPLLRCLCQRLGLLGVWSPYAAHLHQLSRFFTIKQRWSDPILSNNGVPEGCPLSVLMMAVTTWAFTMALNRNLPGKSLKSYVDDWTIRDVSAEGVVRQLLFAKDLAGKVGLILSVSKTVCYATSGAARKSLSRALRFQGLPGEVCDSGSLLGIEFQARGARVTSIRNKRVDECQPKLQKLKVMPWSRTRKASVFMRAILPAMLYGCEFHDMGPSFVRNMRTLANSVVWKGRQYMSHFLSPLLSTDLEYEPLFWILQRCFSSFLRATCLQREDILSTWNKAVARSANKHTLGPITVFVAHLRRLNWTLEANFAVKDQRGQTFCLDQLSTLQFRHLVTQAWETLLVPKLKQRSGMDEINSFSIQASKWESHDPRVNAFMALHRAGGLFTNKVKSRICHEQHPECSLCGLPDGIEHRLYHCSSTQDLRNNADWEKLQSLPRQCLIGGLFPKEQLLEDFQEALDELQPPPLEHLLEEGKRVHLFTDGSCSVPGQGFSTERKAAWSVISAEQCSPERSLLASGPLPGRRQTSFRGELFALAAALQLAADVEDVTIYSDCRAVRKPRLNMPP